MKSGGQKQGNIETRGFSCGSSVAATALSRGRSQSVAASTAGEAISTLYGSSVRLCCHL